MKRINIADVAQKAGVSPTAVSFAFNKPEQLNSETVNRIRMTAIEMGYMPNPMARALIAQRSGIIGVMLPQPLSTVLANPYFHTFLQGISITCGQGNQHISAETTAFGNAFDVFDLYTSDVHAGAHALDGQL